MSTLRRRDPEFEFSDGRDAKPGVCGVGRGTACGVCVWDGVEWGVYFTVELEVGVLLFGRGEFGGFGGGVVGVAETEGVGGTGEIGDVLGESGLDWRGVGVDFAGNVLLCVGVCPLVPICFLLLASGMSLKDCVDGRIVADGVGGFVRPLPIVLTVLAVILFPAFLLWERRQEKLHKTCMMPLYVWKNKSFAAVCVAVFVAWAAFNGVQYFATLTSISRISPFTSMCTRS